MLTFRFSFSFFVLPFYTILDCSFFGIRIVAVVPLPGMLSTRSEPPHIPASRARTFSSPVCVLPSGGSRVGSKPIPSSETVTTKAWQRRINPEGQPFPLAEPRSLPNQQSHVQQQRQDRAEDRNPITAAAAINACGVHRPVEAVEQREYEQGKIDARGGQKGDPEEVALSCVAEKPGRIRPLSEMTVQPSYSCSICVHSAGFRSCMTRFIKDLRFDRK